MTAPTPDHELASEQAYVDAAYARLDAMRRAAAAIEEAYSEVRAGGTHQARLERDIAVDTSRRRLAALDIGDRPLCFGRLDLRDRQGGADGQGRVYIGRIAVDDAAHEPLIVDWRAPVAEPFYRATAVAPMNVARRRHFATSGRRIVGIDDEVFDDEATDDAGLSVIGEGALLRALERDRTGRMGDIVATIQSEQDQAIRADLAGVLLVEGGPGTGKTAVALHRAAYLLYTYRRQLLSQGVLLIGPSPVFLHYIDEVLPALGEDDVSLSTITGLKPGLRLRGTDPAPVTALKGDARMAAVIAKAVLDRERPLARPITVPLDGFRLVITRSRSQRIVERARRRRGSHNARRPYVVQALLDHLVARYKQELLAAYRALLPLGRRPGGADETVAALLARGEPVPAEWELELRRRLRERPEVVEAVERMWPVLTGPELVNDLLGFPALVRSAAGAVLRDDEMALLVRDRVADPADAAWTPGDVALVDEADALLGPPEAARPRRRRRRRNDEAIEAATRVIETMGLQGMTDAATIARRFEEPVTEASDPDEPRTFGHILVDEAQDLTPMQWRMLARRSPGGSFTIVGDLGQASRPGATSSWDDVLATLPDRRGSRRVTLTVNYRTPAEIMDVAAKVLAAAAPTVEPSRSVRRTGTDPRFVRCDLDDLEGVAAAEARAASQAGGTTAVIAPADRHDAIVERLRDAGAVADVPESLDAPIAVLEAADAKGLEFDHVVVVEPAELVTADTYGLRLLYVTITRATRTLAVVHAAPLPEALDAG